MEPYNLVPWVACFVAGRGYTLSSAAQTGVQFACEAVRQKGGVLPRQTNKQQAVRLTRRRGLYMARSLPYFCTKTKGNVALAVGIGEVCECAGHDKLAA